MTGHRESKLESGISGQAVLPWFLNPFLHLALNGLLRTVSELLFKRAAIAAADVPAPSWLAWLGFTALGSWWIWAGTILAIASFICWLHVLRFVPLSIAYPVASAVHVLIPLGAWAFLGETPGPVRWFGISLIIAGRLVISGPMVSAEEKL
ncbi:MAG: hypothetical protein HZA01_10315 [Nitrospinae bacterium]|nr:hypothetical protein [Nitrospinota bacterium]